jgi:hypothetical protein
MFSLYMDGKIPGVSTPCELKYLCRRFERFVSVSGSWVEFDIFRLCSELGMVGNVLLNEVCVQTFIYKLLLTEVRILFHRYIYLIAISLRATAGSNY